MVLLWFVGYYHFRRSEQLCNLSICSCDVTIICWTTAISERLFSLVGFLFFCLAKLEYEKVNDFPI